MHSNVIQFITKIKRTHPTLFENKLVLDCGSLDINGNNRIFFTNCKYKGIDIVNGKNVDVVTKINDFLPDLNEVYHVVISSEMLEHDSTYVESLKTMFRLTKRNGLLLFTAASTGRKEHGTHQNTPKDSPLTNDYYKNITVEMIQEAIDFNQFSWFTLEYQNSIGDIQFAGIKR
jgi:hypothetical protein